MKKILFFTYFITFFVLGSTVVNAAGEPLRDIDGNFIEYSEKYVIKINSLGFSPTYWRTEYNPIQHNWISLSYDIKNFASDYQIDTVYSGNSHPLEGEEHKIYAPGADGFLNYQRAEFFYPHGGLYTGAKNSSSNFTFNLSPDGKSYLVKADDGIIYADQGNTMSMVAKPGHNFSIEFVPTNQNRRV